ncbi:MAG: YidC/Oxa1 family membrane protein insertase [Lachnospiraceae bacterium]|nr:YidC/Oxa1 family membrane protein insertase [Lachnospiraceae bacterium]
MSGILLTQNGGAILGPIARILGALLNVIFNIVPNVGVAIIIFTIIIYIFLLPLTFQQQKFSKLSARMNPEIKAIQEKYKGKKDQESMAKQNEEMQYVYKKYGVSPTGSCVQLLIQMPILFALYRVIYSIPAYVTKVYDCLKELAENILTTTNGVEVLSNLSITTKGQYANYVKNGNFTGEDAVNSVIDVLNRASIADWQQIGTINGLDMDIFNKVKDQFESFNTFLGLNVAYSPLDTIVTSFQSGRYLMIVGAVMVPLLAALTQWINTLFMPQAANTGDGDATANMMKSMNITMPLVSAFFCFSLPIGMGIYWISGAVIRSIEQVLINRHIDHMNIDEIIEKNMEKEGVRKAASVSGPANSNSISAKANIKAANIVPDIKNDSSEEAAVDTDTKKSPGSIAARANMVKEYNERSSK